MDFVFASVLVYFVKLVIIGKRSKNQKLRCFNKFVISWIFFLFLNHFLIYALIFILNTALTYSPNKSSMKEEFTQNEFVFRYIYQPPVDLLNGLTLLYLFYH